MPQQEYVPGVIRVSMQGVANGVSIVNVFHLKGGTGVTGFTQADVDHVATTLANSYSTQFISRLHSAYTGSLCIAQDIGSIDGPTGTATLSGTGIATGQVPASAAICVSWKTGRHYRGGHPRSYFGPLGSSAISSPTSLDPSTVTSFQTAAANFRTACNGVTAPVGGPLTMVCVHRFRDGAKLVPPQTSAITAVAVDNRIDSQRRRLGPDR